MKKIIFFLLFITSVFILNYSSAQEQLPLVPNLWLVTMAGLAWLHWVCSVNFPLKSLCRK